MFARSVNGVQEAAGSNPVTRTNKKQVETKCFHLFFAFFGTN